MHSGVIHPQNQLSDFKVFEFTPFPFQKHLFSTNFSKITCSIQKRQKQFGFMHIQLLTNMQIKLTNYGEVLVQKVGMHQKSQNAICSPEILIANAFCPKTSFSSETITKISSMLQKQNCSHLPPNLDVLPPFCIISRAGHNRNVVDTKNGPQGQIHTGS